MMTKLTAELFHGIVTHHVLLDLRTMADYESGHLPNATNIPLHELDERIHELPTKSVALNMIGSKDDVNVASILLTNRGYNIENSYIAENVFWQLAEEIGILVKNNKSRQLWSANFLLCETIDWIEEKMTGRIGLDIACGSGRDLTFLAARGWKMTGVDYIKNSLHKASQLAALNDVEINTICEDVEKNAACLEHLSSDLIVVMRYLHRPLFRVIKEILNPGGIIVYQTFLEAARFYGKPKNPDFLLQVGELASIFEDYEVLLDKEDRLPDGRPVNSFVAQKPT